MIKNKQTWYNSILIWTKHKFYFPIVWEPWIYKIQKTKFEKFCLIARHLHFFFLLKSWHITPEHISLHNKLM